ncbi:Dicer-like 1 (DCL1) [Phytophthora palmivora]|uniref:Dicer-like 1 (DCL1) n=1 Tax=Phytophthora palmivora TaxID=4796 RepID=A0A2P4XKF1_9STRA|nr:Dicer-like 1 (DCL1) [Phytophthora palmivora]
MDAALWEYQREIAAVARHRSVLVSSSQPVGKTFVSCALLDVEAPTNVKNGDKFSIDLLQAARGEIAILSPLILQETLRTEALKLATVELLVVEDWDLVHTELPSFFKLLTGKMEETPTTLRIFATSRLPASKMDWNTVTNPLLKHIHVFNMLPVLTSTAIKPNFPPLHCEVFEDIVKSSDGEVSVRDFMLGANAKKVDLVHVFRLELELGNSAAVYDERKRQDKVNRFIQDAEAVKEHLGEWCLWKFVELELQANLQACIVDDPDNVNNKKKRRQEEVADDPMNGNERGSDSANEPEYGEVGKEEEMTENTDKQDESVSQSKTDYLIARFIGADVEIDDITKQKDAVRDVDIASDNVWNEFSEQNDKGYLVVPSVADKTTQALSLDWEYVREIIGKPLLEPLWPLPTSPVQDPTDEWICVPTYRLNVSYVVQALANRTVDDIRKEYLADEKAWATHLKKGKSTPGNPILGRWHTRQQLEEADADQPLIHVHIAAAAD